MKDTNAVMEELGISRTWLYHLRKLHNIKPKQKIVDGNVKNYFSRNQVRTMKSSMALPEVVEA